MIKPRSIAAQVFAVLSFTYLAQDVTAADLDQLSLVPIISGLLQPGSVVHASGDTERLFIVEQAGVIKVFNIGTGTVNLTPFLDISTRVESGENEQGLLGLVFHPDYANNGYFYVNYIRDPGVGRGVTVISRFKVSDGNPDVADLAEFKLLEFTQDAVNHNGGDLHFGADGYLYIAVGDGGGSFDQFKNAQDINSLKGKMLRIDVDNVQVDKTGLCGSIQNYAIPEGNPFTDADGCDEVWSYGLRNPWRFSFDRQTHDMYIGDVGQDAREEINLEPPNTPKLNYGWSCREGFNAVEGGNPCVSPTTDPIIDYGHFSSRCSVTGGYVYRGEVTAFNGYYFYGDYCSDEVWLAKKIAGEWQSQEWEIAAGILNSISSFGEDDSGELYISDRTAGKVYRIQIEQSVDDLLYSDSFESIIP